MKRKDPRCGYRRDSHDHRDLHALTSLNLTVESMPSAFSLQDKCPPINDQKQLGACVPFAMLFLCQYDAVNQNRPMQEVGSHLALYWDVRNDEGTVMADSGCEPRDAIKMLARKGEAPESLWPYDDSQAPGAPFYQAPPQGYYAQSRQHRIAGYYRVLQDLTIIQRVLFQGDPIAFGGAVYEQFQQVGPDGVVAMPSGDPIGGHELALVGWDDNRQCFIVRNSWGSGWGAQGYCYMPYAYVLDSQQFSDFWVIRFVP